jgi:CubicO group peptidase (beta-lactamase class C family)
MYYTTDVRSFILGTAIETEPGTRFSHDDLGPLVLGCVLERALQRHPSTRTLSAYLSDRVWKPIGAEYDALWNLDREDGGMEKTESGFTARAIDLTKFGVLYLEGGRWGSRQVLPARWVAESNLVDDPEAPNVWRGGFHKLQWWGRKAGSVQAPHDFYANGHFGQRLYVSPRNRLVLLRMGDSNRGIDWTGFLATIADAFAGARQEQ